MNTPRRHQHHRHSIRTRKAALMHRRRFYDPDPEGAPWYLGLGSGLSGLGAWSIWALAHNGGGNAFYLLPAEDPDLALASALMTFSPFALTLGGLLFLTQAIPSLRAFSRAVNQGHRTPLEDVPGYTWVHEHEHGSGSLALTPDTGDATRTLTVNIRYPNGKDQVEAITLTPHRTVAITTPTPAEWIDPMTRALNDLNTATHGLTRFPSSMPTPEGDTETLFTSFQDDTATINGQTVDLEGAPGERRLIAAVAAVWLSRRLEADLHARQVAKESEGAQEARREAAALRARQEVDQEALRYLLPASQVARLDSPAH